MSKLAGAVGKAPDLLGEFAGQHLFHQLVQEKTAHAPRADGQLDLGRIAGIERDRLDRLQAVRIVIARSDPGQRDGRRFDDSALGCEQLRGLGVRWIGAHRRRHRRHARDVQLGSTS